ncbi:MAG: nitroreductase family protein [Pseudonocardiaceae bacterium]
MTAPSDGHLPGHPRTEGVRVWRLKKVLLLAHEYWYDAMRFITHSGAVTPREPATLRALVTMDTHRIEKGLTVPRPKAWFGKEIAGRLVVNTAMYSRLIGDAKACKAPVDVLTEYLRANDAQGTPVPTWVPALTEAVKQLKEQASASGTLGGTVIVSRDTIHKSSKLDSLDFFYSRRSIRNFAPDPVLWQEIEAAVAAAQRTPSVCNRQSWSVRVFPRGDAANAVLACQNGNTGFGHTASHVLLITVDLHTFVYPAERNQGWIDGGMFAMALIHALHAQGLGACCLNWSVDSKADSRLRAVVVLPPWESVIMMLAIGQIPERLAVASSWRPDVAEVIKPGRLRQPAEGAR